MNTKGISTYNEIMSQGEVWNKVLKGYEAQIEPIQNWIKRPHDEVMFIGCGSTYYLSLAASKVWTLLTNKLARGIPSSEIWYYPDTTFTTKKPLMVAVSRSGETTETINAIEVYEKRFQEECLVISCYPYSPMAKTAKKTFLASEAFESSVAQTRSFTSMFILTQLLAGIASNNQNFIDELKQLPNVFDTTVKSYEPLVRDLGSDESYEHFVFLGSGLYYGLASETMLKMKEMSISTSEVFHFMEFRHGPMSMITNRSLVIGFVSNSRKSEEVKVLQEMKELGATTLAIVDNSEGVNADYVVELKSNLSDISRGVAYLPFLQLLGYYRSISKGLNPDTPTNLSSVVYL